jgi:anti-anti-sigma regulatory factor
MLKITNCRTPNEQRWILSGQLTGPWVGELRSNWERVRWESAGRKPIVDLCDVTFIDESGRRLLDEMRHEGVEFVASGVDTKDVLENLANDGNPPLRRFLAHLGDDCK